MSVYAQTEESKPERIELGETRQFSGRHWTLKISDPQTLGGFYSPGPLCLSTRRKGLSMLWRGRQFDTKMLLRELGVPPWRRESLPMLVWQDEIVAVSTLAVSERFSDQPKGTATKGSYYRLVVAD